MPLFKKILFPVDFSETSSAISPKVIEIAEKFNAEIHVIFVIDSAQFVNIGLSYIFLGEFEREAFNSAERQLQGFLEADFSGVPVTSKIIAGHPGEEILKYAESEGIELIVMGHSRTGMERVIFGSVASYAVRHSSTPVLVIRGK